MAEAPVYTTMPRTAEDRANTHKGVLFHRMMTAGFITPPQITGDLWIRYTANAPLAIRLITLD